MAPSTSSSTARITRNNTNRLPRNSRHVLLYSKFLCCLSSYSFLVACSFFLTALFVSILNSSIIRIPHQSTEPQPHQRSPQSHARIFWSLLCRSQSCHSQKQIRTRHGRLEFRHVAHGIVALPSGFPLDEQGLAFCAGIQFAQTRNGWKIYRKLLFFHGCHLDGGALSHHVCYHGHLSIGIGGSVGELFWTSDTTCLLVEN